MQQYVLEHSARSSSYLVFLSLAEQEQLCPAFLPPRTADYGSALAPFTKKPGTSCGIEIDERNALRKPSAWQYNIKQWHFWLDFHQQDHGFSKSIANASKDPCKNLAVNGRQTKITLWRLWNGAMMQIELRKHFKPKYYLGSVEYYVKGRKEEALQLIQS